MAVVGALACQKNSYLKTLSTVVLSCKEYQPPKKATKKKKKNNKKNNKGKKEPENDSKPETLYEVELKDTVLFPEGGGQPSDTGFLIVGKDKEEETIPVRHVSREGLKAEHFITKPLDVGTKVSMKVDWDRRFDHMQQHTGQHLLSAILDKWELPTLGWKMGDEVDYIEIGRKLEEEEVTKLTSQVNDLITKNIPVTVEIPDPEDVTKTKMPKDYDMENGVLRVVHIGDIDANPCCGTHLCSTAQIKALALLGQEKVRKTHYRLNFICGDRLVNFVRKSDGILEQLAKEMSCQKEMLPESVKNLVSEHRQLQSKENKLMKEVAEYQAESLKKQFVAKKDAIVCYHRIDADLPFISQIARDLGDLGDGTAALFTTQTDKTGAIIVVGKRVNEVVSYLKEHISTLKGGGKTRFQGKVGEYQKGELSSALKYLKGLNQ